METLRQELYQAQGRAGPPRENQVQSQAQASAIPTHKNFFVSRRETVPTKRFSSHEPSNYVSSKIDLPGFASTNRSSMLSPQIAPLFEQKSVPQEKLGEKIDIRSRIDRRLSLQPWQTRISDKLVPSEPDFPDDCPDLGFKRDVPSSEKKKSIWSWKPLRALSHIGRQRFHCIFSAYVHVVDGLPPAMNGLRLCVHMRKEETKDGAVETMASRVFQGIAEFEETLVMKCTLFGSKSPSSATKFMSKAVVLSVIAPDVEEIDLGKHQLDLSRMLAESLVEGTGELTKGRSWDTALELSGKAKGGKLIISFDYEILDKDLGTSGNFNPKFRSSRAYQSGDRNSYSLPNSAHGTPHRMTRANSQHSPSFSEPGDEYDEHHLMERLILDEPLSVAQEVPRPSTLRSKSEGPSAAPCDASHAFSYREPILNNFTQFNQCLASSKEKPVENTDRGSDTKNTDQAWEDQDASTEPEAEFVIIDQGIEMDKLMIHPTNDRNVGKGDHFDNSASPLLEEINLNEDIESTPVQEGILDGKKGTTLVEILGNGVANSEMYEEGKDRTVIWQRGEKKATITYQMIMQTLDSLLEGTTAKVQQHEGMIWEEKSLEERKAGGNVSRVEGAADKEAMSFASQSLDEESDNLFSEALEGIVIEVAKQQELHDNLDQEVDLVAGKFIEMLETSDSESKQNSDSEPNSPRAQLLKQFEQEALLEGGFGLDFGLPDRP